MEAVNSSRPTVFVLLLGERFLSPLNGVVDVGPQDADVDWHSLVAVGGGVVAGQAALLVRNSWGTAWGDGGYAWLTHRYIKPRLSVAATLV